MLKFWRDPLQLDTVAYLEIYKYIICKDRYIKVCIYIYIKMYIRCVYIYIHIRIYIYMVYELMLSDA